MGTVRFFSFCTWFFCSLLALPGWESDPIRAPNPSSPNKNSTPVPRPEKKIEVIEFRDVPLIKVIEWLADQTEIPFIGSSPTGTFTFIPPSPQKTYSITEFIDILNETLEKGKRLLVRRQHCFVLVWTEEKIEPGKFPLPIRLAELDQHRKGEVVTVVI